MNHLTIGLTTTGRPFDLPLDAVTQTFAILAIRGAGGRDGRGNVQSVAALDLF